EIAGRSEAAVEVVEEREIEIELLIAGTVERTDRRRREAAGGVDAVVEEHERRVAVVVPVLAEHDLPDVLGAGENGRADPAGRGRGRAGLTLLAGVDRRLLRRTDHVE